MINPFDWLRKDRKQGRDGKKGGSEEGSTYPISGRSYVHKYNLPSKTSRVITRYELLRVIIKRVITRRVFVGRVWVNVEHHCPRWA